MEGIQFRFNVGQAIRIRTEPCAVAPGKSYLQDAFIQLSTRGYRARFC